MPEGLLLKTQAVCSLVFLIFTLVHLTNTGVADLGIDGYDGYDGIMDTARLTSALFGFQDPE
jgi:hypothetical protein